MCFWCRALGRSLCAGGWRSALATATALDMACYIEGGFGAWRKTGGAVESLKG